MIPKITKLTANDNFTLTLIYSTGETKCFDVKPYIEGSWFGELNDLSYFYSVKLRADGKGIEWPHGQDIAPHELYELSNTD